MEARSVAAMDEYLVMLADLRAKRDAMDEVIKSIEKMLELTNGGGGPAAGGIFSGMTIISAAKKYLRMVGKPASTKEITEALGKGGLQHNAKDLYSSVYAVLRQELQKEGQTELKRHAQDWVVEGAEG